MGEDSDSFRFRPEILQAIMQYLKTPAGRQLKMGAIKNRYSKTAGGSYLSFGCAHCDAIFGNWFVMHESLENMYSTDGERITLTVDVKDPIIFKSPHWCYSVDRKFCS